MKRIVFKEEGVKVIDGYGYGDGTVISINKNALEQAVNKGLLLKNVARGYRKTLQNEYYSYNDLTLVNCNKDSEDNYMSACIIDTFISGIPVYKVMDKNRKTIRLDRKRVDKEDRGDFRVQIKYAEKNSKPVNIAKLFKYYNSGLIMGFRGIIDDNLYDKNELHHEGMVADNRISKTMLFSKEEHQKHHNKYGETRHTVICRIESVENLEAFLKFLNSDEYDKYVDSLKKK